MYRRQEAVGRVESGKKVEEGCNSIFFEVVASPLPFWVGGFWSATPMTYPDGVLDCSITIQVGTEREVR